MAMALKSETMTLYPLIWNILVILIILYVIRIFRYRYLLYLPGSYGFLNPIFGDFLTKIKSGINLLTY